MAETDYEIGRVIQAFKDTHRYENTLTIYITGDNGASAEGGINGAANEFAAMNGINPTSRRCCKHYDDWGGPDTAPLFATPWAWAIDTPFKWTKQVASYFGGTQQGVVIVCAEAIKDAGGIRSQFTHVIDVAPTMLEAAGIRQPDEASTASRSAPSRGRASLYTFDTGALGAQPPPHAVLRDGRRSGHVSRRLDGKRRAGLPAVGSVLQKSQRRPALGRREMGAVRHVLRIGRRTTTCPRRIRRNFANCKRCSSARREKYNVFPLNADRPAMAFSQRPGLKGGQTRLRVRYADPQFALGSGSEFARTLRIPSRPTCGPPENAQGHHRHQGGHFGGYALGIKRGQAVFHLQHAGTSDDVMEIAVRPGGGQAHHHVHVPLRRRWTRKGRDRNADGRR